MGCGSSVPQDSWDPPAPANETRPTEPKDNDHQAHKVHDNGITSPPVTSTKDTAVHVQDSGAANMESTAKNTKAPVSTGGEKKTWRDILKAVSMEDLWSGIKREDRPVWREKLEETEKLVRSPRSKLPEDKVLKVLSGELAESGDQPRLTDRKSKVVIFISSTFTDTQAERNVLIRDVYPYLRKLCRNLGLDFGTVDMRWGVKEEMTMEHGTTAMCLAEVERCNRESAGPAFLSILSHKYGYRTLPAAIEKAEFEKLVELLKKIGNSTSVEDFYQLDTNAVPAVYVLKPRKSDDKDWWNREKEVVGLFRSVANNLGPDEAEKYFISITEQEIKSGFLENPLHTEQVISLKRVLTGICEDHHLHRHMLDMKDGKVDDDAQNYLKNLKEVKIPEVVTEDDVQLNFEYNEDDQSVCKEYVMATCDKVCEKLVELIIKGYKQNLHTEKDPVFYEAVQHLSFAKQKSQVFVGREKLLDIVHKNITQNNGSEKQVFAVHGRSGCGKTALMAVVAKTVKEAILPKAAMILRFIGTTSDSGSARSILYSICAQISRIYGQNTEAIPTSYGDLIKYFQESLHLATAEKPLVVILDSLDQLSNEDFGQNLKWLSLREKLPAYAHVIVSTIPSSCLTTLKAYLPSSNLTEVLDLTIQDGPLILEKMLAAHHRTVTPDQKKILLNAFSKCPLPLYLRLAVDIALKWHSYDVISGDAIASDMPGVIGTLFERLESKFGFVFVQHALAYITCAKDGLSVAELEDVLSCDDDVLDEIFDFWLPPFRRIPQLLWIRVRNELGMYLMERGTNGVDAYGWYHRQFWETAASRYVEGQTRSWGKKQTHQALADYFDGTWAVGKLWTPKKITRAVTDLTPRLEDRQVPHQPLVLSGKREIGRQLNKRKLSELPHHLIKLEDWARFEERIATLEFIEAKFEAEQGYDCQSVFLKAAQDSSSKKLRSFSKFVGLGLAHFLHEPVGVYQLAVQQVRGTAVRQAFEEFDRTKLPSKLMRSLVEDTTEDPCEMTMMGHTSGVRCVQFHPMGHVVASTSEDGSLRLWDVFSGAEIVTVTGLPGPRYSGLADPYHGERPCVWDRKGKYVITGSEDGGVQVWDISGAQVLDKTPHTAGVTGLDVSIDNSVLATASKDGTVKIWNMTDFSLKTSIDTGHCLDCVFSPDGSQLAVSMYGQVGLCIINCSNWSIRSTGNAFTGLNICVAWSPRGSEIVTGGDDSSITVWDPHSGQAANRLTSHRAWIWCVHYNSDGTRLLSCSSDRSMKLWNMNDRTCIVSLGGHAHRVTSASFRPNTNDKFVSASLDMNVKVWDYEAVAEGRVPKKGGLNYIIVKTSPCGKYHATCQGWSKACTLYDSQTGAGIGESPTHYGFILDACFTPDSKLFATVDTGHTGAYESDSAARRANAKVCSEQGETELDVSAPCAVSANNQYIAIGNIDGEIALFTNPGLEKERTWSISSVSPVDISTISCSMSDNVISVGTARLVSVWDMSNGSLVAKLPKLEANLAKVLYCPSGEQLLIGIASGRILVYNAMKRDYQLTATLSGHSSRLVDMAFSLWGGDFLATASVDLSMRIWDVNQGYAQHSVFYAPVGQLGFSGRDTLIVGESTGNKRSVQFET